MDATIEKNKSTTLPRNHVKLIRGGKDYFDLLIRLINVATKSIHLQTYIYDDDETGIQVANALKAAARRNVTVYMIADGYASQVMSRKFIRELQDANIRFRFFEPILKSKYFYFGRRLHHKVAVIDSRYSLVGGVNITNRYNDMPGKPAWLDFALYTEGIVSAQLHLLCSEIWNSSSEKITLPANKSNLLNNSQDGDSGIVKMRRNDWVRKRNEIFESYLDLFSKANSTITIVCSYFLPGKRMRLELSKAAARGVTIKILIAGQSDIMIAKHAERWMYDWLLRNKVELYEYQHSILHAKLAICDNAWFTIGSYNINNISAYATIELNLDVHDPVLASEAVSLINSIIKEDAIRITPLVHLRTTNIFKKLLRWFSYQFIRIVFNIVTSYYKQRG